MKKYVIGVLLSSVVFCISASEDKNVVDVSDQKNYYIDVGGQCTDVDSNSDSDNDKIKKPELDVIHSSINEIDKKLREEKNLNTQQQEEEREESKTVFLDYKLPQDTSNIFFNSNYIESSSDDETSTSPEDSSSDSDVEFIYTATDVPNTDQPQNSRPLVEDDTYALEDVKYPEKLLLAVRNSKDSMQHIPTRSLEEESVESNGTCWKEHNTISSISTPLSSKTELLKSPLASPARLPNISSLAPPITIQEDTKSSTLIRPPTKKKSIPTQTSEDNRPTAPGLQQIDSKHSDELQPKLSTRKLLNKNSGLYRHKKPPIKIAHHHLAHIEQQFPTLEKETNNPTQTTYHNGVRILVLLLLLGILGYASQQKDSLE